MKCDSKMLLNTAAVLGIAVAVAYFTLPAAHAFILAAAPLLLVLVCPLSMLFMMKGMTASTKDAGGKADRTEAPPDVARGGSDSVRPAPQASASTLADRLAERR